MRPLTRSTLFLLALVGCESDDGLKKYVQPPVVAIETPASGAALDEGVPVVMKGLVTDEAFSASLTSERATWSVNGAQVCEGATVDVTGVTECTTVFERGEASIMLTVTNPDGQSANAVSEVTVAKNEAPSAEIVLPVPDGEYYSSELTLFEGLVSDGEDLAEELTVTWTSSIDGVLAFATVPGSDGKTGGTVNLNPGDHTITLQVTDSTGRTGSDTSTLSVTVGSKPTINLISPVSGDLSNLDEPLLFEAEVGDGEDDADTLEISWESSIDGVFSTQGASSDGNANFSYDALTRGSHTITVTVTDSDGLTARDSATLYVNEGPTAPYVVIEPDPTTSADDLSVIINTASVDPDGDTISYSYAWYRNGVDAGYTSNPLPASAVLRGEVWSVYVTPNDGNVDGPSGSDTVTIGNSLPSLAGLSVSPSPAYTNDTLTATAGAWTDVDGDAEAIRYQWYVNGWAVSAATGTTLADTAFVRGDVVEVTATPYDSYGDGVTLTSAALTITNSTPGAPTVDVTPNSPERENDLLCSASAFDADGDSLTYTYSWTKNGVATGLTSESVSESYTENGETWTCTVTASDGTATGASASDTVVIDDYVNVAPEAPTISLSPSPADSDEAVTTTITAGSYDLDGDTIAYSYLWYKNGVSSGVTTSTLSASLTTRGDTWSVVVTPNDGHQDGATATASVSITNSEPTVVSVAISPTTLDTDSTLTATPSGWADDDGDSEAYTYQWYLNGAALSGATTSTLGGAAFVKGDTLFVTATATDGYEAGNTVTSAVSTVGNATPTTPGVDVTPNYPEDDDTLTCAVATASTDADGDAITYSYAWYLNGVATGIATSTVAPSYTNEDETWTCYVTASDGTSTSAAGSDSAVVSDYTAPDAPVIAGIDAYRDETGATLVGTAEADTTLTLYVSSSLGITTTTTTVSSAGTFSLSVTLTAGYEYTFYATATDAHANVSAVSNVVGTEVCDPIDEWEDSTAYGDSCADPVAEWTTLADSGADTVTITGNLLVAGDEDWYVIDTSDALTSGINYYRFHVELTAGSSEYAFAVYKDSCSTSYLECDSGDASDPEGDGYLEYEDYAEDTDHTLGDSRYCYDSYAGYNNCEDLSGTYYIHVFRTSGDYSCQEYTLNVTNGSW